MPAVKFEYNGRTPRTLAEHMTKLRALKKTLENAAKKAKADAAAAKKLALAKKKANAAAAREKRKAEAAAKKLARDKKKANAAAKKLARDKKKANGTATKKPAQTSKNALKNSNWNNTVWATQQKRNNEAISAFKLPNYYLNKSSNGAFTKNYRKMKAKRYNLYSNELVGIDTILPTVSFKTSNGKWKTVKQLSKERNEKMVSKNMREKLAQRQANARMSRMTKYVESLPPTHGFLKANRKVAFNFMVRNAEKNVDYFNRFKKYVAGYEKNNM